MSAHNTIGGPERNPMESFIELNCERKDVAAIHTYSNIHCSE